MLRSSAKILIVDDSRTARETLGALLYSPDYELHFAENGSEALEKAAVLIPDLILLDVMMPDLDGYEVCELLRQDEELAEVPIIMVTALDDRKSRLRGIRAGADDFISKPVDTTELGARVQMIVRLNRYRRLHDQRRRFEQIIQFSPDGITIADENGKVQLVNQTMLKFLRTSDEGDVLGKPLEEFLLGDNLGSFRDVVQQVAFGEKEVVRAETLLGAVDKTFLAVELVMGRFQWEERNMVQITMRDLTERNLAEEALKESEERYHKMMQMANDAIVVTDLESFQIVEVNEKAQRLLGIDREALLAMQLFDLYPAEAREDCRKFYAHGLDEERQVAAAFQIIGTGGEMIDVEITNSRIELANRTLLMGIFRDVSERREQERVREALLAVSIELRKTENYDEVFPIFLGQVLNIMNAEGVAISLNTGEVIGMDRRAGDRLHKFKNQWSPEEAETRWTEERPFAIYDKHDQRSNVPWLRQVPTDIAVLEAPLITSDEVLGSLWVGCRQILSDQDGRVLASFADLIANAIQRKNFLDELERRLEYLQALFTLDSAIAGSLNLELIFKVLLQLVNDQLDVDVADVYILYEDRSVMECVGSLGFYVRPYLKVIPLTHLVFARKVVESGKPVKIADMRSYVEQEDIDPAIVKVLLEREKFESYYGVPLKSKGKLLGVLEVFHREVIEHDETWVDFLMALADQAAIALSQAQLFDEMQKANEALTVAYDDTIEGWALALELRDNETQGHSWRVTELAVELGKMMGISGEELIRFHRGAVLHDIGKMGVPDRILHKQGELTAEEWEIMKKHPEYGYEMLSNIDFLHDSRDIVLYHHERWDGMGYPTGLKGEEIPLSARVFAIIDVWDAVTNNRPYHKAWSTERALRYVRAERGKHFDPNVVDTFLKMVGVE